MIAHPQSIHRYSFRVYYEDTDAGGVVYHASYLRYAERARTEALREAKVPHAVLVEQFSLMFMVRRIEIDYVRPAKLDDLLVVETETLEVGGATALLCQTVRGPQGICATLRIRLACIQIGRNKPARIPPRWREAMLNLRCHLSAGGAPRNDAGGAPGNDAGGAPRNDMGTDTQRRD